MSYFTQLKIWDGTNIAAVKAASTAAVATDPALVVAISPNNVIAVTTSSGSVTAATLSAETTKVIGTIRILGNIGAIFDGVPGSAVPANAIQIGGSDGANIRTITTDTYGNQTSRPASPTTANWTLAAINFSANGAQTIIAGVMGQTIRVMRMNFQNASPTTTTTVSIQDSTPTAFTGPYFLNVGGSFNGQDSNGEPLYVSASGAGIQLNVSTVVQISGSVWYTQS